MKNNTAKDMAKRDVSRIDSKYINGITAVELLMTLALVGASAGLATPRYLQAVDKHRLTNGAEQVVAFVNTVQSESIRRNKKIAVSYAAQEDGSWCFGAVVGKKPCDCTVTDSAEAGSCNTDSSTWLLRDTDLPVNDLISSVSGDGAFTFDPVRGVVVDMSDMMTLEFQSEKGLFQMNLHMIATGRITLCQPANSIRISGYKSCLR